METWLLKALWVEPKSTSMLSVTVITGYVSRDGWGWGTDIGTAMKKWGSHEFPIKNLLASTSITS